jgi:adenylate cyclase
VRSTALLQQLRERGVLRVAASYAVIAWLLLQIADVTFEPLGVPRWVMITLIATAILGFPVAIALAWHFELGDRGLERDLAADAAARPVVHGLRRYADVAIIGVLLATVAALLVRQSDIGKPPPPDRPTIAVLPFANLSGDPEQEYFSDGLAQELLDRLGRVPGLAVIGRSSSFSLKGKDLDTVAVAERLGATTILEGAVRRDGPRLRVSATLLDGRTGRTIWSQSYDRAMTDVFAMQEDVAAAVIASIVPAARGEPLNAEAAPMTADVSAYDLYLLGLSAQEAQIGNRARDAVNYLEQALRVDPKFAKAHAALARALLIWLQYPSPPPPADAERRAEAEIYKALALDPRSSEAYASLCAILSYAEHADAEANCKRALELNPNNTTALWEYWELLHRYRRPDEADAVLTRLAQLDPASLRFWRAHIRNALWQGGADAYKKEFDRALQLFSADPDALNLLGRSARTRGFAAQGLHASLLMERAGNLDLAALGAIIPLMLVDNYPRARFMADWLRRRDQLQYVGLKWALELAGLTADWSSVDALSAELSQRHATNPKGLGDIAFWLAVQGRYAEAAEVYARAGPLTETGPGWRGEGAHACSGSAPALLRTYRAMGRADEAQSLATRCLALLRRMYEDEEGTPRDNDTAAELAALAANEGYKDEAVRALRTAVEHKPFELSFHPRLPWYRNLEGHPGYADYLAERQRRMDEARAEMESIYKLFPDSVIVRMIRTGEPP